MQNKLWASLELFNIAAESPQGLDRWAAAMAYLINDTGNRWFRWFHSGDLQSPAMARAIFRVCELTKRVRHWMPTRERDHIRDAEPWTAPRNLTIRWSGTMVNGNPPKWARLCSVISTGDRRHGRRCPAHMQGNACGDCRACWDQRITVIEYEVNNVN